MPDQIISKEKDEELLPGNLAERRKAEESAVNSQRGTEFILSSLISTQLFKDYNLDETDMQIINSLFNSLMNGEDGIRATKILKHIDKNKTAAFRDIKRIMRLKQHGIIETGRHSEDDMENIGALLRSRLQLTDSFINRIYNKDKPDDDTETDTKEAYKDNLEYLSDQFERIRILKEINSAIRRNRENRGAVAGKNQTEDPKKLEGKIAERLSRANEIFPFEEFKKKKKLNRKEELIILAMLEQEMLYNGQYSIDDLLDIISQTPYERLVDIRLFQKDGRLIREKIIETGAITTFTRSKRIESIKLNDGVKAKLFGEKKRQKREKFKGDRFFETIKPSVPFDKVILHPKTSEELSIAIEKIEGNAADLLREWGIKNNLLFAETGKKRRQPVVMLFHGPPGTGKTLAANAIAYRLGREIITFDCSNILSKWVGESEQNTRKVFDKYKAISKGRKNSPVLLLNEADQFLHRRINATRSTDHMYNQMQNIFLEQLEKFEGMLIATTNLIENLDSAFSRRFHHKIEFRRPGSEERLKLWQIHIPEKTPLSDDVSLQHLAEHYDLSGGQIAVVIQNAAVRAVRTGNKEVYMADFITACNEEMRGNFDERARSKVGF